MNEKEFKKYVRRVDCYCEHSKRFLGKKCYYCRKVNSLLKTETRKKIRQLVNKIKKVKATSQNLRESSIDVSEQYLRGWEQALEKFEEVIKTYINQNDL